MFRNLEVTYNQFSKFILIEGKVGGLSSGPLGQLRHLIGNSWVVAGSIYCQLKMDPVGYFKDTFGNVIEILLNVKIVSYYIVKCYLQGNFRKS